MGDSGRADWLALLNNCATTAERCHRSMTCRTRIRRASGSRAAQSNKTVLGVTAMWKRLAAAALLMIFLGSASGSVLAAPAGSDPGPDVDARVYIFRGDLGIFFSTGMDYLAAELNQRGLNAGVYPWKPGSRSPMMRSPIITPTRTHASCWLATHAAATGLWPCPGGCTMLTSQSRWRSPSIRPAWSAKSRPTSSASSTSISPTTC